MATSFEQVRKRQKAFAEEMAEYSGVDIDLILKIIQYAQMLPAPGKPNVISEVVFKAQMGYRFGITSQFHLEIMYEAVKRNASRPGTVHVDDYVRLLCMFYSDKLQHKIDFVFSVYDIDCNGNISLSELHLLLRSSVIALQDEPQSDEPLKELIEIVLGVVDINRDGSISLDEFRHYVNKNILFIQLLGQVLPTESELENFMTILRNMNETHLKEYFRHERSRCLSEPPLDHLTDQHYKSLYSVNLDFVDFL